MNIKIYVFYEIKFMVGVLVVDEDSVNLGIKDVKFVVVEVDYNFIVKF